MVGRTSPLVMLMNVMARPFDLFVHVLNTHLNLHIASALIRRAASNRVAVSN